VLEVLGSYGWDWVFLVDFSTNRICWSNLCRWSMLIFKAHNARVILLIAIFNIRSTSRITWWTRWLVENILTKLRLRSWLRAINSRNILIIMDQIFQICIRLVLCPRFTWLFNWRITRLMRFLTLTSIRIQTWVLQLSDMIMYSLQRRIHNIVFVNYMLHHRVLVVRNTWAPNEVSIVFELIC